MKTFKALTGEEIFKRYFEGRAPDQWDLAGMVTDLITGERHLAADLVKGMIPEWEERESHGASIKQALEDAADRIEGKREESNTLGEEITLETRLRTAEYIITKLTGIVEACALLPCSCKKEELCVSCRARIQIGW